MTQIDGVETSEQFDFGPFNVHQFALDLDTLKSAEIVRSAGSALYGSDALGGVVSFFTKDPSDYLGANRFHFGAKAMFDGRSTNGSGNAVIAGGRGRLQGSAFLGYNAGHEPKNQGSVETEDRPAPRSIPQDREGVEGARQGDLRRSPAATCCAASFEAADNEIDTEAYSSRGLTITGPIVTNVADIDSFDTMDRWRGSVDQMVVDWAGLNTLSWNLYAQQSDTAQVVDEVRITSGAGPATTINRSGTLDYTQDTYGGGAQARKAFVPGGHALLVTFGGNAKHDVFDMLRDRLDVNAGTGAVVPPVGLILPSKYFPKSAVDTVAGYVQGEMKLGAADAGAGRALRPLLDGRRRDRRGLHRHPEPAGGRLLRRRGLGAAGRSGRPQRQGHRARPVRRRLPGAALQRDQQRLHQPPGRLHLDSQHRAGARDQRQHRARPARRRRPRQLRRHRLLELLRRLHPAGAEGRQPRDRTAGVPVPERLAGRDSRPRVPRRGPARRSFRLRGAYAYIKGDDVSGDQDVPLNTIAPNQGVIGLEYSAPSSRWGSEFTVRGAQGQSQETAGAGLYAPAAYAVADVTGWLSLAGDLTLRGGVLNLTDTKYFEWANVRGRPANDPVIDRYTSPGISALVSLAYGW